MDPKYAIDPPPEHLRRHKEIYERHKAGEIRKVLAAEFGISITRVQQLERRWQRQLYLHEKYGKG